MKTNLKRFFSMMLALSLVFGLVVPANATKVHAHDHDEEAKQEASINMEAVLDNITVNTDNIELEVDLTNKIVLADPNTEVDTEDPAIIAFEADLKAIKVWDEAAQQPVPLTEEQIQQVLGLYQQYLNHWTENADTLGLQVPFFLEYNDKGEDGLGVLGEMLALAGIPVDAVRAGYMTMDDLTGMILNFYYGDQLGVQYYGKDIAAARDEVMQLIKSSGAVTEAQKLLVINDWLAHNNTFDMPYIMNADKDTNGDGKVDENDDNKDAMVAENPVKHEHYDDVLSVMTEVYVGILTDTFETQIRDGLKNEFKKQYYTEAIKNIIYQGALGEARQDPALMDAVKEALNWQAAYEAALEAAKKEVYDEAYAQYMLDNHEHELTITLVWTEVTDEDGNVTAYNCEEATVVCGYEGCTTELTATVELKTETVEATCTETGKVTYTATATVTVPGAEEGATVVVGETTDSKEVVLAALDHNFVDGECTRCHETEVCEHVWNAGEVTTDATCGTDGVKTFTCTKCEETKTEVILATGEHVYEMSNPGVCDECGMPHVDHVPDMIDSEYCSVCYAKIETADPASFSVSTDIEADTVADDVEGEGDEDEEVTEPEINPEADAHAQAAVEAALPDLEAAAEATANEQTNLEAVFEMTVTGGTEEVDTDVEKECWKAAEEFATENADAIAADPVAFVDGMLAEQPEAAAQIHGGWEGFWTDCETNGIPGMVAMFSGEIWPAVIEQFYIQGMVQQYGMTEEEAAAQAAAIMEADAEAIADDPYAYCVEKFGEEGAAQAQGIVNDQLAQMGIDGSTETNPDGRVSMDIVVALQMDTPMADLPQKEDGTHMTPNEAVPVFAAQAAEGLTGGIINYWEGSHFGALGFGTSVCLGYTKAFTYLVQCLHPEIYGVNGAETDMSVATNWKTRDEVYVYGEDGKIDINQNYVVDAVRVTFDASVTMYGETEDNFNSDHFWNAVKIDGKWYYADPCYTDVFTEVMMRDRVETDGQMNHLYFLFSHTAAVDMYDGNYKEIKSLYSEVATDETFEDAWFSRIKSNTYFADGYAYYLYDSTDMLTLMEEYENQNQNQENQTSMDDNVYKIVRHKLDSDDSGDGDTDYEDLIIFNYKADDDSDPVGRVWDEETSAMVDSELLTELWKKHEVCADIYPSIMINAALYNGKIYFNLANCILSYDIATSEIVVVKEYNTVHGVRDTTKPFGGMAFTTTTADNADFTFENHPIAGMTIKDDGNMYVSIATNLAFISGKADRCDPASEGFGYEYEESNYNSSYNSYMDFGDYDDDQLADFGYTKEVNDNDEFMWTANFVEKISMSTLTHSHSYEAVSVAATCGVDAYTENRCSSCGVIEAGTRVYEEGTALEHHYIEFEEIFYTKDDGGAWNEGLCLVCTNCGYALTRPSKPSGQMAEQEGVMEDYEEALAIYEAAEATAGHDYVPTDATWAEDNSSVSFKNLSCSSVCPERKNTLDCLINDKYITVELKTTLTADAAVVETIGLCEEGVTLIYEAAGEAALNGMGFAYTARKIVELEPAACTYVDGVCSVCGNCAINRIYGNDRIGTALSVAAALKNTLKVEKFDAIILAAGGSGQDQTKFADALSGSYLASAKNAPILLYTKGDLAQANLEFIAENLSEDGTIYLLGGNVSIPAEVEAALVEAGYTVKRLAGDDRYLTNLAILKEVGVEGVDEVLIAGGQGFADSLSASATGLPIMLVKGSKTTLTEAQIEFLKSVEGKKITILGGNAAVSAELEAAIEEVVGKDVDRVFGETREETSVMIAKKYFPEAKMALITYSKMYPDGLAGGVLANVLGAPLLLTKAGSESIANEYIEEIGIEAGYVLGGSAVMTDETAKAVFGLPEHAVVNVAYFTE